MMFGYKTKPNFTVENEAQISAPPKVDFGKPACADSDAGATAVSRRAGDASDARFLAALAVAALLRRRAGAGPRCRCRRSRRASSTRPARSTREQNAGARSQARGFEAAAGLARSSVLMVPTTGPRTSRSYASRVADDWKIGRKDVGDGVLVVVAKDDREMRIEVAKALEGAIPDVAAARIIDEHDEPRFRADDFAGGIDAASTGSTRDRGRGAARAVRRDPPRSAGGGDAASTGRTWRSSCFFGVPVVGRCCARMFGR